MDSHPEAHAPLPGHVAAVDLGSNSFHMLVARPTADGGFVVVDRLKEQVRQSWEADSGRAPGLNALNDNLKQIALGRQGAPLLGSPRAGLPGHPPRPRGPCAPRPRAPARLAKCQRSPPAHCPARSAH